MTTNRAAAYLTIFTAGITSVLIACLILDQRVADWSFFLTLSIPAGLSAVLGAFTIAHWYLSALNTRRRLAIYGRMLVGVLAAHLYYPILLVLLFEVPPLFVEGRQLPALNEMLFLPAIIGAIAVILGLPTNFVLGTVFTEVLLRRYSSRPT